MNHDRLYFRRLTARHTIPQLQVAGGGSIVDISSIAAARGHGAGAEQPWV